jgi:hypothetical protein
VTLKIPSTTKPADRFLMNHGVTDALAPFPLHCPRGHHDGHHQQQHRQHEHTGRPASDAPS